jgi:hypothetical protein
MIITRQPAEKMCNAAGQWNRDSRPFLRRGAKLPGSARQVTKAWACIASLVTDAMPAEKSTPAPKAD